MMDCGRTGSSDRVKTRMEWSYQMRTLVACSQRQSKASQLPTMTCTKAAGNTIPSVTLHYVLHVTPLKNP